jgi:hypothetical protein
MGFFTWCKGLLPNRRTESVAARDSERIVATRVVRASRAYSCKTCGTEIAVGDRYSRITYRASGKLETNKYCLACHALMAVDRP